MKTHFYLLAVFGIAAAFNVGLGQETEVTPPPPGKTEIPAHLRVWAMVFEENSNIAVRYKKEGITPVVLMEAPGEKPMRGSYLEVPKGAGEIELLSGGVPTSSVKLDLLADDYRTLLVSRDGGKLGLQVLQDPIPGQKDFPPAIRLLNFGTGRVAEVTIGAQPKVVVPENRCLITPVEGKGEAVLRVALPDPMGGPAATSTTDVNMGTSPSWSVVMIPDYRGKLRPRVSPDGKE